LAAACAVLAAAPAFGAEFRALSPEEGAAIITSSDEFTSELSAADLSIRLRRADGGNLDELQALYRRSTQAWTEAELARLAAMMDRARESTDALAPWLPEEVGFIKVTEAVEGGFPHTRANAIIWGAALPETDAMLDFIFYHELWHVLSRRNAARHDEMYALVGFSPCTRAEAPAEFRAQRLTNPDAPLERHVAPYEDGNYLLPMLLAGAPAFDPARQSFGDYLSPKYVLVNRDEEGVCRPIRRIEANGEGAALVLNLRQAAPHIFAAAGRNTNYIIHPEEALADNFAQLMTGRSDAPNPEVQERLAAWLGIAYEPPTSDPPE